VLLPALQKVAASIWHYIFSEIEKKGGLVPGASHLFEKSGALEEAARLVCS
jgi:hypothetical protein